MMETKGKIAEIFTSIQGEGLYLGEKQLFIRFFGCNIQCSYCDTKPEYFTEYDSQQLQDELKRHMSDFHSVAFTGGEPLLQKDFLKDILKFTWRKGLKNYLETNGTLPEALEDIIDYVDIVAMDIKFPSSTGAGEFWQEHRYFLKVASRKEVFIKMVVCHSTEEHDFIEGLRIVREVRPSPVVVLQPNGHERHRKLEDKIEHFKNIAKAHHVTACVIPQVHKAINLR